LGPERGKLSRNVGNFCQFFTMRNLDHSAVNVVLCVFCRYFTLLKIIFCFAIPIAVPPLFWDERWQYAALGIGVVRYVASLNFTWLVNSAAHIWGKKPYDR
jgi:fatty-acid desaturase